MASPAAKLGGRASRMRLWWAMAAALAWTLVQAQVQQKAAAGAKLGGRGGHMKLWLAMAAPLAWTLAQAQQQAPAPAPPTVTLAPAPAPMPPYVNVTQVVAQAAEYSTFANLMVETKVDEIFQRNANATQTGITIFAPQDDAFTGRTVAAMLSTLNDSQKTSLVLYHALNNWVPLATLQLTHDNQTTTLATYNNGGGKYLLNLTSQMGMVEIVSAWTTANVTSTLYSQNPISVFGINQVLLPEDIFGLPSLAPAPSPSLGTPTPTPSTSSSSSSTLGPSGSGGSSSSPSLVAPCFCPLLALIVALVLPPYTLM